MGYFKNPLLIYSSKLVLNNIRQYALNQILGPLSEDESLNIADFGSSKLLQVWGVSDWWFEHSYILLIILLWEVILEYPCGRFDVYLLDIAQMLSDLFCRFWILTSCLRPHAFPTRMSQWLRFIVWNKCRSFFYAVFTDLCNKSWNCQCVYGHCTHQ